MEAEVIALSLLGAVEGAHFFSARLPSKMTIWKFVDDELSRRAIKQGIVEASVLSLTVAIILSWITKSHLPFTMGAIFTAIMAYLSYKDLMGGEPYARES